MARVRLIGGILLRKGTLAIAAGPAMAKVALSERFDRISLTLVIAGHFDHRGAGAIEVG
jgi:hypothetical protein